MIRYPVRLQDLEKAVDQRVKGWRKRAAERTAKFAKAKKFDDKAPIWSEVKPIFMTFQGENKCIYCERKFGSVQASTVEHDLEHFRPKGNVAAWELPAELKKLKIKIKQPAAKNSGYYLLPYHLENYSSSCKTCNTIYKLDRFPVAASYKYTGKEPQTLLAEEPLLLFPVGSWDVDPEDVLEFHGYMPQVKAKAKGKQRARGLVTIAFFGLDDLDRRSDLFRERAEIISIMYRFLKEATDAHAPAADRKEARAAIARWISEKSRHANCARSFKRLFETKPAEAKQVAKLATDYWASKS
jgi:hypothetical protein